MVKRKIRQRGILQLAEGLHVFSTKGVDITPRAHLRHKNTTSSQVIGPVIAPDWSSVWREAKSVKDRIYGASGRILAGGRLPVDDVPRPSFEDACDPVAWHAMPVSFIEELVHKFELRVLCDATCGSDEAALACLRMGISYVGLCWSEEHVRLLQSRLVSQLWKEWTNPESPIKQNALPLGWPLSRFEGHWVWNELPHRLFQTPAPSVLPFPLSSWASEDSAAATGGGSAASRSGCSRRRWRGRRGATSQKTKGERPWQRRTRHAQGQGKGEDRGQEECNHESEGHLE